ncbi:hypothetical protein G6F66_014645 [Rhizopus arrhizus]|nr:hypothetical protein G6F66_014645 [Rhizopus arrhizus]
MAPIPHGNLLDRHPMRQRGMVDASACQTSQHVFRAAMHLRGQHAVRAQHGPLQDEARDGIGLASAP